MRQITQFADFDVTFPARGPSDLVCQAGGRLYRMPLETETPEEVDVDLVNVAIPTNDLTIVLP